MRLSKPINPNMSVKNADKLRAANELAANASRLVLKRSMLSYRPGPISARHKALFAISMVYKGGAINYDSYKANVKNLKDGIFLRRVKTYTSPVDKSVHSDEEMLQIWIDHAFKYGRDLEFEDIISALKLCDFDGGAGSRNDNYQVGRYFYEVLMPMHEAFCAYPQESSLRLMRDAGIPVGDLVLDDWDNSTYCCEDCDGPIESYQGTKTLGRNAAMSTAAMEDAASWLNAVRFIGRDMYDGPDVFYISVHKKLNGA